MRKLLIPLCAALLAAPFAFLSNGAPAAAPVSFAIIAQGNNSQWSAVGSDVVVRTQAEWNRVWLQHAPAATPPVVDFTQNDVYCSFMGLVFSSGHTIKVMNVSTDAVQVLVKVDNTSPGINCPVFFAQQRPFQMVSVPKQGAVPVTFRHQFIVNNCP